MGQLADLTPNIWKQLASSAWQVITEKQQQKNRSQNQIKMSPSQLHALQSFTY